MRSLFRTVNLPGGLLWLLLLLAAGCDGRDRLALGTESNDPYYRQGDQLKRQGRYQEALGAYLKVIEKRRDDAPESHLEAGLIYQQYLKDPIYAIFHFRKYLELAPNSRQADLVRQRVDAAMRDFARSLPAQPLESQAARLDLMGRIDELQKENLQLKEDIARLHQGGALPADNPDPAAASAAGSVPPRPVKRSPLFNPPPAGQAGAAVATAQAARPSAAPPPKPPPTIGRRHVVSPGETLYKIAQLYYGSGSKWPQILEANRDVLKNENAVRAGMELKIP
jgi:tetratricopeptide (TPR) repeat protein